MVSLKADGWDVLEFVLINTGAAVHINGILELRTVLTAM